MGGGGRSSSSTSSATTEPPAKPGGGGGREGEGGDTGGTDDAGTRGRGAEEEATDEMGPAATTPSTAGTRLPSGWSSSAFACRLSLLSASSFGGGGGGGVGLAIASTGEGGTVDTTETRTSSSASAAAMAALSRRRCDAGELCTEGEAVDWADPLGDPLAESNSPLGVDSDSRSTRARWTVLARFGPALFSFTPEKASGCKRN